MPKGRPRDARAPARAPHRVGITIGSAYRVRLVAARGLETFTWDPAAATRTAVGTILLALVTTGLALETRRDVGLTAQIAAERHRHHQAEMKVGAPSGRVEPVELQLRPRLEREGPMEVDERGEVASRLRYLRRLHL